MTTTDRWRGVVLSCTCAKCPSVAVARSFAVPLRGASISLPAVFNTGQMVTACRSADDVALSPARPLSGRGQTTTAGVQRRGRSPN